MLISYGLTTAAQYLLRMMWFREGDDHTNLALFELFFTLFFLPIFLVTTIYWMTIKLDKKNWFSLAGVIICSCIYLSARLGFLNWADSVGSRDHPDSETLMVIAFEWQGGLIVTLVGLVICYVKIFTKRRSRQS